MAEKSKLTCNNRFEFDFEPIAIKSDRCLFIASIYFYFSVLCSPNGVCSNFCLNLWLNVVRINAKKIRSIFGDFSLVNKFHWQRQFSMLCAHLKWIRAIAIVQCHYILFDFQLAINQRGKSSSPFSWTHQMTWNNT